MVNLLETFILGFIAGFIPGPVLTTIFTETIRGGAEKARRVVWLAGFGECLMAILSVVLLSFFTQHPIVITALSIFGALLLLFIASDLWKLKEINEEEPLFSNKRIVFVALFNGMAWAFWITVCAPQAIQIETVFPQGGRWIFVAVFEIGWFVASFLLCMLFSRFRYYFQNNEHLRLLYRGLAILFILFAVRMGYAGVTTLLR